MEKPSVSFGANTNFVDKDTRKNGSKLVSNSSGQMDDWDQLMALILVENQEVLRRRLHDHEVWIRCVDYLDWIREIDKSLDKSDVSKVHRALLQSTEMLATIWSAEEEDPLFVDKMDLPTHQRASLAISLLMFGDGPRWEEIPIKTLGMLTEGHQLALKEQNTQGHYPAWLGLKKYSA